MDSYIILFQGDDSDFTGNQAIEVKLDTTLDLTNCKATFKFLDYVQTFDSIPETKILTLTFPAAQTKLWSLGSFDAEMWLTDENNKRRTIANRIHIVITKSVKEAYENEDTQAITVIIRGGGGSDIDAVHYTPEERTEAERRQARLNIDAASTSDIPTLDETVTETSSHGVKSSGIWTWVKSLLPSWLTANYAEPATVASVTEKYTKPTGGVPKSDLSASVQATLDKANTALQELPAHAESHGEDGDDSITVAQSQVAGLPEALAKKVELDEYFNLNLPNGGQVIFYKDAERTVWHGSVNPYGIYTREEQVVIQFNSNTGVTKITIPKIAGTVVIADSENHKLPEAVERAILINIGQVYGLSQELSGKATPADVSAAETRLNDRIDLIEVTSHPNMSIVGNPTFTEGVVSGFSANDYLMFSTNVDVKENAVDFYMAFTTGANVTTQQNILDSWCGLAFAIQNGGTITAASQDGTTFVTASSTNTIAANTSYRLKLEFRHSGGSYTVTTKLATGSGEYAQIGGVVTLTAPVHPTATYWGGANPKSGVQHIFGGSINLAECRMDWNGKTVWRGYTEVPTYSKGVREDGSPADEELHGFFGAENGVLDETIAGNATVAGKYAKPSAGIPKSDMAQEVQNSLSLADSALQSYQETDPVWNTEKSSYALKTAAYKASVVVENGKNVLVLEPLA